MLGGGQWRVPRCQGLRSGGEAAAIAVARSVTGGGELTCDDEVSYWVGSPAVVRLTTM